LYYQGDKEGEGVFLLSLKSGLILLLIIFSVGVASAQWTEEPMADLVGEGTDESLMMAGYSGGEDGPSPELMRMVGGSDPFGATGPSGVGEAYYSMEAPPGSGPEVQQYSISGHEPSTVYFGGEATSYGAYSTTYGGTNSLWILGSWSWSQYAYAPLGAYLQLLAYSSSGGSADFYEIYPSGNVVYKRYSFWPGYSRINFHADATGRHILLFIANNQPSNAIIIDVGSGGWPPTPGPGPGPVPSFARVTVRSSWLTGYTVTVDDIQTYSDASDGRRDGIISFTVPGNQYHSVKITSPGYLRSYYRFFRSGYAYTLTV
jgi:hypothetical protein